LELKKGIEMAIDYDTSPVFEALPTGRVEEHSYVYENFDNGEGIQILFRYPALISQVIASWENSIDMVLSVQLPSGIDYTIKTFTSSTSLVLNHRESGSNDFIFWFKLPANSKLRFGVDGALAPGDFKSSIIAKPVE
jgi:hypothetical protein